MITPHFDPNKIAGRLLARSRRGIRTLSCLLLGTAGIVNAQPPSAAAASGDYSVQPYFSSEFHPRDSRWFTNPWSATDANWRYKLAAQPPLSLTQLDPHPTGATINVNPATTYQPVLGMGTSLDETSVYALSKNHSDAQTEQALTDLIDPVNGIGMNLFRLCIGTSDFADGRSVTNDPTNNPHGWYTYQDGGPTSPFSIQHDIDLNIVHVANLVQDVAARTNHPVKFFASAWSPPAWMKDSNSITGGNLLNSMVSAYAAYLRKFVQAYAAQGIPIYAITTGNEHYYSPTTYPSCAFTAQQEAAIVKALTTEFAANNITTKIWILDHNYDYRRGIVDAMNSLGAANQSQVDSVAYHHYSGKPSDMSTIHNSYPSTGIQFTEGSVFGLGEEGTGGGMDEIVQNFRNWSSSYVSWVTMTTQTPSHNQGLYNSPGNLSPTLLIRHNGTETGTAPDYDYFKIPEYYLYGQFMKFIQPGALRIYSDGGSTATTTNVAFKNPDGTIAIVVVNQNNWDQNVRFVVEGNQFNAAIPAASVATYTLKSGLAASTLAPAAPPALANPVPLPTGTGTIVQEWFFNENGSPRSNPTILTNDPRYPNSPTGAGTLSAISRHDDSTWGNSGSRICGCVVPSITGAYTFYVHGDGWAQLYLSTDSTPANLRVIATCPFYSGSFYQYLGPGQQASVPIQLVAGQKYYFETLQTGGGGNGQSAVAWDMPGIANGRIIAGKFLAPSTASPPPAITSALTATATTAVAFNYQLVATNTPLAYTATGLPAGLTINTQTGVISGSPTTAGTYKIVIGAINVAGTVSANLSVTVGANPSAPDITSAGTASGVVGTPFSYSITATNNPTSFNAGGLPAGLTVNTGTGVISGTPTTAAKSTITLSATNAYGTVTQSLVLTVTASGGAVAPAITSATSASGTTGSAFSYTITASNSPTSFNATGLPGGLAVNTTTGVISGTPGSAGTSSVALSATNSAGTGTATLTLTVSNPPPPVPVTPVGVTGFGWDAQVDLRWTPSTNATGYKVARSTAPTGTYTVVASNITTPYFSDTAGLANATTYYYQVSAVGASGTSAASAALGVLTRASGDNAWSAGDIGAANPPGTADYGSGSYTLTSAGVDVWGRSDAFQFMSQPLVGDGTIVARVASVSNSNAAAKAGVMIRASLSPDAANMSAFASPGTAQGITAQWRLSTGALSYQTLFTGVTAPYWVKLVRAGSTFTAYRSTDGVTWTAQSMQTISMTGPVYAGLALAAHNSSGTVCTATFDSVSITPGAEWFADDLGLPAIDGFNAYSNNGLTVNGSGVDIWGNSDQLRYVYQPASGDCNITVRVTGVENSNLNSKGGVMIRETLAANSAQVDLVLTPNAGVYMQARAGTGAVTNNVAINGALQPPYWLRLARVGNTITGLTSPDGTAWTTQGSTTVGMGANTYLGIATTSHDASKLGTSTIDNISVGQ